MPRGSCYCHPISLMEPKAGGLPTATAPQGQEGPSRENVSLAETQDELHSTTWVDGRSTRSPSISLPPSCEWTHQVGGKVPRSRLPLSTSLFYFSTDVTSVSQADPHPTPGPAPGAEGLWPGENLLLRLWPGRKSPGRTLPLVAWTSSPICSVHRNATQQPPTCSWNLGLNLPLCIWRQPSTPGPHRARSRNQTPEHPGCPAATTREPLNLSTPGTILLSSGN